MQAPIDFDESFLNKQIRLRTGEPIWPLKTTDSLALLLEANAPDKIIFPNDFNLRIFYQEGEKWVELPERPVTRLYDLVVMTPEEPASLYQIVDFWPEYPDVEATYYMRVYVFGDMSTPEGVKEVAAFIDFVVTP
jgi:hypothetical protein